MKNSKFIILYVLISCISTKISSMESQAPKPITMNTGNIGNHQPKEVFVLNPGCFSVFKAWIKDHCCNIDRYCCCGPKCDEETCSQERRVWRRTMTGDS